MILLLIELSLRGGPIKAVMLGDLAGHCEAIPSESEGSTKQSFPGIPDLIIDDAATNYEIVSAFGLAMTFEKGFAATNYGIASVSQWHLKETKTKQPHHSMRLFNFFVPVTRLYKLLALVACVAAVTIAPADNLEA